MCLLNTWEYGPRFHCARFIWFSVLLGLILALSLASFGILGSWSLNLHTCKITQKPQNENAFFMSWGDGTQVMFGLQEVLHQSESWLLSHSCYSYLNQVCHWWNIQKNFGVGFQESPPCTMCSRTSYFPWFWSWLGAPITVGDVPGEPNLGKH
jgi:hypothetical protein